MGVCFLFVLLPLLLVFLKFLEIFKLSEGFDDFSFDCLWVFAFNCEVLDLDSEILRRGISDLNSAECVLKMGHNIFPQFFDVFPFPPCLFLCNTRRLETLHFRLLFFFRVL